MAASVAHSRVAPDEIPTVVRVSRTAGFFVLMVAIYWVYRLFAVPWIEPPAPPRLDVAWESSELPVQPNMAGLFEPGAWELGRCTVIRSDQAILLFQEYVQLDEGRRLELKPCTVVFFAGDKENKAESAKGRPIVLRAPDRAVVSVSDSWDPTRTKANRFQAARLEGEITIYSPETHPGADDAIWIETQGVQIEPQKIWTPHEVKFRWGANEGAGRDLSIFIDSARRGEKQEKSLALGSIRSLELLQLDRVRFHLPTSSSLFESKTNLEAGADSSQNLVAQISCTGPFRFEIDDLSAVFDQNVHVTTLGPEGPLDQLRCDSLTIRLKEPETVDRAATGASPPLARSLTIEQLEAFGSPASIDAPTQQASARAQWLAVNLLEHAVRLKDAQTAVLHWREQLFEGRNLKYSWNAEDPQRLGRLVAEGPGHFQGPRPGTNQVVDVFWSTGVNLEKQIDHHVMSIVGNASIRVSDFGTFQAEALHVWLEELVSHAGQVDPQGKPSQRFAVRPDKLLAVGGVVFDSPQLSGTTQRLEAWIRYVEGEPLAPPKNQPAPTNPMANGDPNQNLNNATPWNRLDAGGSANQSAKKFRLDGDLIRIQLVQQGKQPALDEANVEGNVRLVEIDPQGQVGALDISGNRIALQSDAQGLVDVAVMGEPATVRAQAMVLESSSLSVSQPQNRIYIVGAGKAVLPPAKLSSSSRGLPTQLQWNDGLQFDGQQIQIDGDVVVNGQHLLENQDRLFSTIRSQQLLVTLRDRLDLKQTVRPGEVELAHLRFPGDVEAENHGVDVQGQKTSDEWMRIRDLQIAHATGEFTSQGEGSLSSVRYNKSDDANPLGSFPSQDGNVGQNGRHLVYLNVRFAGGLAGNFQQREVRFRDRVRAIYGPVLDWDSSLDPDRPETWGNSAVLLSCHELLVAQLGQQRTNALELQALGNTTVEGKLFTATADRVSYDQSKDLLTLAGDARNNARLQYRFPNAGQPSHFSAGRISYSPKSGRLDVDDARQLEFFQDH